MKKSLLFLLVIVFLFSLTACAVFTRGRDNTVTFYYLASEITYGSVDSMIAPERIEAAQADDLQSLLGMYLSGPVSPSLKSPFPAMLSVTELSIADSQAHITLNREINRLSGIDLCVACACLAKTVFSNTDVQSVSIYAEGGFSEFDGAITFTRDNIITYDDSESELSGS